jgi:biopolymer transport protein ExbB
MTTLNRADVRAALWLVVLMTVAAFVWGGPDGTRDTAFGQEVAEEIPVEDAAGRMASEDETFSSPDLRTSAYQSLGELIVSSGVFGWVFYSILAVFSISAMAVALGRLFLLRRGRIIPKRLVSGLRTLIQEKRDSVDNLRTLCDASPSPAARILRAGLLRAGRPLPEVEKSMEDAAAREMAELRSRNRPLSVVGSVAPLVGLLGTVVGMIFAFRISSQAGLGKAELLAEGIYLALMTTAAGLTIAIPCLLLFAWFNTRAEKFMREIDEALLETLPGFARMENHDAGSSKPNVAAPASETPSESIAAAAGTRP